MSSAALAGKVAVVTGSGRGLGLAYAKELARQGARVVINDVDQAVADAAVVEVDRAAAEAGHTWDSSGGTGEEDVGAAVAVVAPVGPAATADLLVRTAVDVLGRLDVLVTNAGVLRDTVLWKMSDDDFDTVLDVHLRGTFTCVRAAAVQMRAAGQGGRIVCVGSPTGQRGNFGQTNYAAAKAGVVGMVRTWAMELARANVTVNAIVPVAATAMTETVPLFQEFARAVARDEELPPFARRVLGFGTPDDAAGLVAFLASDAAAAVTGQAVGIGGDRLTLWSHPQEVATAFADGGWSFDTLVEDFGSVLGGRLESVGQELPKGAP